MHDQSPNSDASDRARWLAELNRSLDQAQELAWQLGVEAGNVEAMELYARLELVRWEIEGLQLGRANAVAEQLGPEWSSLPPWRQPPRQ